MICDNCGARIQVMDDESLWCPVCDWKGVQGPAPDLVNQKIVRPVKNWEFIGSDDLVNQKIVPSEQEVRK